MKYFDLINRCLTEMNYREANSWNALTLNDHKRLKEVIRRLNSQICVSDDWPFLQRHAIFKILKRQSFVHNPISGKLDVLMIDDAEYTYSPDYKRFLKNNPLSGHFSTYHNHILLPQFNKEVECRIFYNTDYSARDASFEEKKYLENQDDESLIPEPFQEPLLVYGACMRLKSNTEHNKFKFWYSMYTDALATLRSKCSPMRLVSTKIIPFRGN